MLINILISQSVGLVTLSFEWSLIRMTIPCVRRDHSNIKVMFYGAYFHSKEQKLERVEKRTTIHSEQEIAQNKRRLLSDDQMNCRIKVHMTSLRYWVSIACNLCKTMLKDIYMVDYWNLKTCQSFLPAGNKSCRSQWPMTCGYFTRCYWTWR